MLYGAEFFGNAGNACNLASINLYNLVDNPFTKNASVNLSKLIKLTEDAIIALNNILEYGYSMQPLDYNRKCIDDWRSIGLGIFGLADMLIALGLRYGSEEANEVIEDVMNCILISSLETSSKLAKKYGTFGKYNWEYTKESPLIKMFQGTKLYEHIKKYGLRNGTLLSVAPAGTISTMCGISNGCEPIYEISYERTTHSLEKQGKYFKVYAKSVEDLLRHNNIDPEMITTSEIKKHFPFVVESQDITPEARVRTQAVLQQYVDNAISSTVNLKELATVQEIFDTYMLAWKLNCKGLTVFRTGCKRGSILGDSAKQPQDQHKPNFNTIAPIKSNDIGDELDGKKVTKHTACVKNLRTHVYNKDGDIVEVYTHLSGGGCASNIGTITRLVSLALRSGIKVEDVIEELKANSCNACLEIKKQGKNASNSCGYAIGESIEKEYKRLKHKETIEKPNGLLACPECGKHTLRPEGKCFSCSNCSYSKCE